MSEQGAGSAKSTLDEELEDREAVLALMELYSIDESTAQEIWSRFRDTVEKLKDAVTTR
jgi:hypothetical protein